MVHQIPPEIIALVDEFHKQATAFHLQVIADQPPPEDEEICEQSTVMSVMFYLTAVASMHHYGTINPGQIQLAINTAVQEINNNFVPVSDKNKVMN